MRTSRFPSSAPSGFPKADPKAVEDDYITVYDASSGQTKQMKRP